MIFYGEKTHLQTGCNSDLDKILCSSDLLPS